MAQFVFENDLNSILKLDTPITNAPLARWQRKAKEGACSSANTSVNSSSIASPMRAANRSHSSSKTPSKTPGKSQGKLQGTPSRAGGDRFIPNRSAMQMDVASFLLSKENETTDQSPTKKEQQKAWAVSLNGFDMEEAKILRLGGKSLNAPEGYQNSLKVLYSQKSTPGSSKKPTRYIPSMPDRVLDAPEIRNDYYLNLIDWSTHNLLAVALNNSVYLWNHLSGDIILLLQMESADEYISSVSWFKEGHYLAIGTSNAEVQLWDVQQQKRLRTMVSHSSRVGSLCWNDHILSRKKSRDRPFKKKVDPGTSLEAIAKCLKEQRSSVHTIICKYEHSVTPAAVTPFRKEVQRFITCAFIQEKLVKMLQGTG